MGFSSISSHFRRNADRRWFQRRRISSLMYCRTRGEAALETQRGGWIGPIWLNWVSGATSSYSHMLLPPLSSTLKRGNAGFFHPLEFCFGESIVEQIYFDHKPTHSSHVFFALWFVFFWRNGHKARAEDRYRTRIGCQKDPVCGLRLSSFFDISHSRCKFTSLLVEFPLPLHLSHSLR